MPTPGARTTKARLRVPRRGGNRTARIARAPRRARIDRATGGLGFRNPRRLAQRRGPQRREKRSRFRCGAFVGCRLRRRARHRSTPPPRRNQRTALARVPASERAAALYTRSTQRRRLYRLNAARRQVLHHTGNIVVVGDVNPGADWSPPTAFRLRPIGRYRARRRGRRRERTNLRPRDGSHAVANRRIHRCGRGRGIARGRPSPKRRSHWGGRIVILST